MLGNGEVVGKLETSWDELLHHGDEPFDISFPPVRGVHPSLMLKAAVVHACDNQDDPLLDSIIEHEIARDTDAGHARFSQYVTSGMVSHLNDAVGIFSWFWATVRPTIQTTQLHLPTSRGHASRLYSKASSRYRLNYLPLPGSPALRPQGHPDHPSSLYHLTEALTWRYIKKRTAIYIRESAQLYYELLPLCPEGTYLRSIAAGANGVDYVICACNNLPTDASDEGIHLRRIVLDICPLGHQHRPRALHELAQAVEARFDRHGTIDDLDECIQHRPLSLRSRFNHQRKSYDLNEAISLYEEEALRLHPVGHKYRDTSLDNLGGALRARFDQRK
ncbi:hypothetical protein EDB19DRAFT_1917141 [Suillus lakei]|nr:hypothetical protein EDB19DRAFT_1917141 [Suillus lakei]